MKRTLVLFNNKPINLANKCTGKTTLLVYNKNEKPKERKPDCVPKPHISFVQTKKIRVCTGAELKKVCRPTPCECPPQLSKFGSFLEILYRTVLFGVKSAIVGSLVYYTWEAGIWGDSEDTEEFYYSICQLMYDDCSIPRKVLTKTCEKELEIRSLTLPSNQEDECLQTPVNNAKLMYRVKQSWNHTVTAVFEGITQFPYNVMRFYEKMFGGEKKCIKVDSK